MNDQSFASKKLGIHAGRLNDHRKTDLSRGVEKITFGRHDAVRGKRHAEVAADIEHFTFSHAKIDGLGIWHD